MRPIRDPQTQTIGARDVIEWTGGPGLLVQAMARSFHHSHFSTSCFWRQVLKCWDPCHRHFLHLGQSRAIVPHELVSYCTCAVYVLYMYCIYVHAEYLNQCYATTWKFGVSWVYSWMCIHVHVAYIIVQLRWHIQYLNKKIIIFALLCIIFSVMVMSICFVGTTGTKQKPMSS